jgi:hypothetical protein
MTFGFPFDQESSTCPRCGKPVAWKWATGPRGGFVSEPHNALIADCVYHAECWDALVAEHPPGEPAPTEYKPEEDF